MGQWLARWGGGLTISLIVKSDIAACSKLEHSTWSCLFWRQEIREISSPKSYMIGIKSSYQKLCWPYALFFLSHTYIKYHIHTIYPAVVEARWQISLFEGVPRQDSNTYAARRTNHLAAPHPTYLLSCPAPCKLRHTMTSYAAPNLVTPHQT